MSVFLKHMEVHYLYYDTNYCSKAEWKRLLRDVVISTLEHLALPCSTRAEGGEHACVLLCAHMLTCWPFVLLPVKMIVLFIPDNSLDKFILFLSTPQYVHHFTDMKSHISAKRFTNVICSLNSFEPVFISYSNLLAITMLFILATCLVLLMSGVDM